MSFKFNPFTGTFDLVNEEAAGSLSSERLEVDRVATGAIAIYDPVSLVSSTNVSTSGVSSDSSARVFGIALSAANNGETLTILMFGNIEDPAFTFALNKSLFQSLAGPISDQSTTIVGEFFCLVGRSNGTGSIFVNPGIPTEVL